LATGDDANLNIGIHACDPATFSCVTVAYLCMQPPIHE
jgi:hypothetical protein